MNRRLVLALSLTAACEGAIGNGPSGAGDTTSSTPAGEHGRGAPGAGQPGQPGTGAPGTGTSGTPGSPGTPGAAACGPAASVGAGKWWRLTAAQYRNSIHDLLGVDADTSDFLGDTATGPFAANALLPPQDADIDHYRAAAEAVAARAVSGDLKKLLGCDPTTGDTCANAFIADFGGRAYRRPLAPEELTELQTLYKAGKADSFAAGIGLVIEGALQSPSFLYLTEFGTGGKGVVRLSGYEVAARVSYLLWNTTPDADLLAAAKAGGLDDAAGVRKQADRLLASDRFLETVRAFHTQLLGITHLTEPGVISKDAKLYPEFDDSLRQAMTDEARRFVEYVFTKGGATVDALLTAPYAFPAGPLLKVYGVTTAKPNADGRLDFADGTRNGILTQAAVLAAQPQLPTRYTAVHRGKMVRNNLLCQEIAPPQVAVNFMLPPNADKLSAQDLLRAHQNNPSCAPCHTLLDNVGFGLENYDAIGRYRSKGADGTTIDASGNVAGSDVAGPFAGPRELVQKLAQSQDVRGCFATQWFRYTLGRDPADADACSVQGLQKALGAGDLRQALLTFVQSDAFRFRRTDP